jgi:hypothetical protein
MNKLNISRKEWIQLSISLILGLFFIGFLYFKAVPLDHDARIRVGFIWLMGAVMFFVFTQLDKGYAFYSLQMKSYKSNHSQDYFWVTSLIAIFLSTIASALFFIMAYLK